MIIFKEPIENKAMRGHVIKSAEVHNQGSCRVMCYMEPDCVSINFGPSENGRYKCELNSASDDNQLSFLGGKDGYTFLAIEVNLYYDEVMLSSVDKCLIIVFCLI